MAHYQNQYGAVTASKDPIQKEMETTGDTTGVAVAGDSGSTQLISEDYYGGTGTTSVDAGAVGESENHHKKGIMEKIKEKLSGIGTHHK